MTKRIEKERKETKERLKTRNIYILLYLQRNR
jgi:hypothetical protein